MGISPQEKGPKTRDITPPPHWKGHGTRDTYSPLERTWNQRYLPHPYEHITFPKLYLRAIVIFEITEVDSQCNSISGYATQLDPKSV